MKKSHALQSHRRRPACRPGPRIFPLSPVTGALRIEKFAIQDLRPYRNNPRLHPKSQIDKLARAISDFGFLIPVLVDDQNTVISGHARIEAAKKLVLRQGTLHPSQSFERGAETRIYNPRQSIC